MIRALFRHRRLTSAALAACLVTATAGGAWAQQQKTAKPRSQVEQVPGEYIQLETIWVPVLNDAGNPAYLGMVVRLYPGGETRYEACVEAPQVAEEILIDFNRLPISRQDYEQDKLLNKRIREIVDGMSDKRLYRKAEAFREFVIPDQDSAMLSATCK